VEEWIAVARILRARGNRGELAAESYGSQPERFVELGTVFLFLEKSPVPQQPYEVEDAWDHNGHLVLKFRGVDSISEAELLRGAEVRIPKELRPALPEGEYYHSDLYGCKVIEKASGEELGTVSDVEEPGGPSLLVVDGSEGELLIPLVKAICIEVDIAGKRIIAELPEGLKELNRR
jgi:16S rRNA processing protein RimM